MCAVTELHALGELHWTCSSEASIVGELSENFKKWPLRLLWHTIATRDPLGNQGQCLYFTVYIKLFALMPIFVLQKVVMPLYNSKRLEKLVRITILEGRLYPEVMLDGLHTESLVAVVGRPCAILTSLIFYLIIKQYLRDGVRGSCPGELSPPRRSYWGGGWGGVNFSPPLWCGWYRGGERW